jgi:hypothetical protein
VDDRDSRKSLREPARQAGVEGSVIGQAAREYVARYYNRDVLAAEYLQLLCRVAGTEQATDVAPPPVDLV